MVYMVFPPPAITQQCQDGVCQTLKVSTTYTERGAFKADQDRWTIYGKGLITHLCVQIISADFCMRISHCKACTDIDHLHESDVAVKSCRPILTC